MISDLIQVVGIQTLRVCARLKDLSWNLHSDIFTSCVSLSNKLLCLFLTCKKEYLFWKAEVGITEEN